MQQNGGVVEQIALVGPGRSTKKQKTEKCSSFIGYSIVFSCLVQLR